MMTHAHATGATGRPHALVTGAARGIGLSIATQLAHDGFHVVATDIDVHELEKQAAVLCHQGLSVQTAGLDVQFRPGVARLIDDLERLDVVVNNAGMASTMIPLRELDSQRLRCMLRVNLMGSFIVAQEALRRMSEGGRIIQIASRGYLGGAGAAHYVASKGGVVGMVRAMAIELRWRGIAVNAVAPGMVDTRMLEGFSPEVRRSLEQREPSGAAASPQTIADTVAFLASPRASQLTGQVIFVDGGKSVGMPPL